MVSRDGATRTPDETATNGLQHGLSPVEQLAVFNAADPVGKVVPAIAAAATLVVTAVPAPVRIA